MKENDTTKVFENITSHDEPIPKFLKKIEPLEKTWYFDELIGRGGFSEVYRLKDEFGQNFIAAKVMKFRRSDVNAQKRLFDTINKLEILECLNNCNNIVNTYGHHLYYDENSETKDIYLIILMELLLPLESYLKSNEYLSEIHIAKLGMDLCTALIHCQKQGIVHRDIKPSNIFVSEDGTFKLGDFNIAELLSDSVKTPTIKGTYTYMAPEVFLTGFFDYSCDIYSLGVVLYQLMNNNILPYAKISAPSIEDILQRKDKTLVSPVNASTDFAHIILKACSYEKEQRYESANILLLELKKLQTLSDVPFGDNFAKVKHEIASEETILVTHAFTIDKIDTINTDQILNNSNEHDNPNGISTDFKKILKKSKFRMINWFGFTCLFSFIPLFVFLLCRALFDKSADPIQPATTEFLYFALSISIIVIRELSLERLWDKDKTIFVVILISILCVLIFSTILFGIMKLNEMKLISTFSDKSLTSVFWFSVVLSIFSFLVGSAVQLWEEMEEGTKI